jgi:predicted homoserine dehydrogenase-like protein
MSSIEHLPSSLRRRIETAGPIRVGLIGAGKFGSMFLAQIPTSPHLDVVAIADLDPERARTACSTVGWSEDRTARTRFVEDGMALIAEANVEVVIEATGSPLAGVRHALAAAAEGKHIVMVNVEADVLAGPWLAAEARRAGVVYSLAYGDQPALVCELVDWARTCGFAVVAAGKGTRYQRHFHGLTPATVWSQYGLTEEAAKAAGMNAQMFCSFMDGTKSAIEMAAIANATGLKVPEDGLAFPPCSMDDLQNVLRPREDGGVLAGKGSSRSSRPWKKAPPTTWSGICAGASMWCSRPPTTTPGHALPNTASRPMPPAGLRRSTGPIISSGLSLPCRWSRQPAR